MPREKYAYGLLDLLRHGDVRPGTCCLCHGTNAYGPDRDGYAHEHAAA
jgi:hypothetical protein